MFGHKTPRSVSLVLNRCDNAENNLKIIDNQPRGGVKKEFGVCVKQLTYPNREFIIRFIEWIQMCKILGAEKIHFYNRLVHPELIKIVEYFENQDLVEMLPFLEPTGVSNEYLRTISSFVLEAAVINDCFYRVKNLYKYIAILDPDEMIMPVNESHRSWHDLLQSVPPSYDFYASRMITFPHLDQKPFEGVPQTTYMLYHVEVSPL